jgi:hypothetical protein
MNARTISVATKLCIVGALEVMTLTPVDTIPVVVANSAGEIYGTLVPW